jgi:2,5-furandicarboxylate decarboxylase 1
MGRDLRTWIAELEAANELLHIRKPVDPATQMGALLYQSREKGLLFEDVVGHPGWRVLGQAPANPAPCGHRVRYGPPGPHPDDRQADGPADRAAARDRRARERGRADRADVNLLEIPAHVAGSRDAGPFIASGLAVTRDPDTGCRNVSFHRLQVKGRNKTGALLVPRHTFRNFQSTRRRASRCRSRSLSGITRSTTWRRLPPGRTEWTSSTSQGGFLGEPVPLVKCETVDLEVPADAEIVIEGHVLPGVREREGPFSEFTTTTWRAAAITP